MLLQQRCHFVVELAPREDLITAGLVGSFEFRFPDMGAKRNHGCPRHTLAHRSDRCRELIGGHGRQIDHEQQRFTG